MAEQAHEDVVRRAYQAFNEGDAATLTEVFDPDVVWHTPGANPLSGTHQGRDATFGMFATIGGLTDGTYRAEVERLESDGDEVTSHYRATGKREGRILDATSVIRFRLAGGRITEATETPDDQAAWDAFMS